MFARLFLTFCLTNAFVPILSQFIDDLSIGRHSEPVKSLKDYSSGNARTFNVFDHSSWNSVVRQIREGFGQTDVTSARYSYQQPQPYQIQYQQQQQENQHVKTVILTKHVPQPYKIETERRIPHYVKVPVEKPYPVYIPKPYTITMGNVFIPQPFTVEKNTKPYPVYKEKIVNYAVGNPIYYPVKVPYDRPYPVHVPVAKKVPYAVEKEVPYLFIPVHEHSQDQDYHEQNNIQTFALPTFTNPTSTTNSVVPVENNPANNALDAVQFINHFSQSSTAPPSSVSDNSFDGSVNVAQSVPAPTTTVDEEDDEESTVTELPSTSTSQSANLTSA